MDVAELVEDLMAYIPLPPSGSRTWLPDACLNYQPGTIQAFANVSALRASDASLGQVSAAAARFFGARGRSDFLWFLGPRSTPADAVHALTSLGATSLGAGAAMVLDHEPASVPGVEVRQVRSADDLLTYRRIGAATEVAGDTGDDVDAQLRASNDAAWQDYVSYEGRRLNFLAFLDGEPVSAAGVLLTDHGVSVLSGAATLPAARGRGMYRALVHARWTAVEESHAGPLAVQASTMSSPVLARLGFTTVAELTLLRQMITA